MFGYVEVAGAGGGGGSATPGGNSGEFQYNNAGAFAGASQFTLSSSSIIVTSADAAAFVVGPNGNTNPTLRVVTNVASAATGLSITGNAAGSGVNLTVLSSGSDETIRVAPKGTGVFAIAQPGGTPGTDEVQIRHDGSNGYIQCRDGSLYLNVSGSTSTFVNNSNTLSGTNGSGLHKYQLVTGSDPTIRVASDSTIAWNSTTSLHTGVIDTGLARSAASVVRTSNGSTGIGAFLTAFLVEANTAGSGAPNVLTATESRTVLTNEGATAENYHTLPSAVAGLEFTFIVQDSDGIRITAAAGDTIRPIAGTAASATGGFIRCATLGAFIRLAAINSVEWIAVGSAGTWTIDV